MQSLFRRCIFGQPAISFFFDCIARRIFIGNDLALNGLLKIISQHQLQLHIDDHRRLFVELSMGSLTNLPQLIGRNSKRIMKSSDFMIHIIGMLLLNG